MLFGINFHCTRFPDDLFLNFIYFGFYFPPSRCSKVAPLQDMQHKNSARTYYFLLTKNVSIELHYLPQSVAPKQSNTDVAGRLAVPEFRWQWRIGNADGLVAATKRQSWLKMDVDTMFTALTNRHTDWQTIGLPNYCFNTALVAVMTIPVLMKQRTVHCNLNPLQPTGNYTYHHLLRIKNSTFCIYRFHAILAMDNDYLLTSWSS